MISLYKNHRTILIMVTLLAGCIAWIFDIPYYKIASDAITLVTIAIAIYFAAVTLLIGSKTAGIMNQPDYIIKTKTQMGVFMQYLKWAILVGLLSIVDSYITKIYCDEKLHLIMPYLYKTISSIGIALLAAMIFFIWIIFEFISAVLIRESHSGTNSKS